MTTHKQSQIEVSFEGLTAMKCFSVSQVQFLYLNGTYVCFDHFHMFPSLFSFLFYYFLLNLIVRT